MRSRQFAASFVFVAVVISVFSGATGLAGQAESHASSAASRLLENSRPGSRVISYQMFLINISISVSNRSDTGGGASGGSYCYAQLNSTAFEMYSGGTSGNRTLVEGAFEELSPNVTVGGQLYSVIAAKSFIPDFSNCLAGELALPAERFLGSGVAWEGSPNASGFVSELSSSSVSLTREWRILGATSAGLASLLVGIQFITGSAETTRKLREQGARLSSLFLPWALAAAIGSALVGLLALGFTLIFENAVVGLTDDLLGPTTLYSRISAADASYILLCAGIYLAVTLATFSAGLPYIVRSQTRKPRKKRFGARIVRKGRLVSSPILLVLFIAVLLVTAFAALPFQSVLSYAADFGFAGTASGYTVTAPGSVLPFTSSLTVPGALANCSSYSGEVALPIEVAGLRSIARGVSIQNSTRFTGYALEVGFWPASPYEVALGSSLAARLGVRPGESIELWDTLTGSVTPLVISAIFSAPSSVLEEEALLTLPEARALAGLGEQSFGYFRVGSGCAGDLGGAASTSLGIPEIVARLDSKSSGSARTAAGFGVFAGANALANEFGAIATLIVLAVSGSSWITASLYLEIHSRRARRLWEQGASARTLYAKLSLPASVLAALAAGLGFLASYELLGVVGAPGVFHYESPGFLGWADVLFVLACALPALLALSGASARKET